MKSSGTAIPGAAPARRIAELFLQGAATFAADHVDLFDGVLIDLVPHSELAARADLAERLSFLANAPRALVGQLARDALGRAASADGKATIGCHSGARVSANFDVQLHIGESRDSPMCNRTSEVRCFASPGMKVVSSPISFGASEPQISRMAAFAFGFASVSRHRVIGPWQAPVGGLFGGPDEIGRA
jgi:hypothetical protein